MIILTDPYVANSDSNSLTRVFSYVKRGAFNLIQNGVADNRVLKDANNMINNLQEVPKDKINQIVNALSQAREVNKTPAPAQSDHVSNNRKSSSFIKNHPYIFIFVSSLITTVIISLIIHFAKGFEKLSEALGKPEKGTVIEIGFILIILAIILAIFAAITYYSGKVSTSKEFLVRITITANKDSVTASSFPYKINILNENNITVDYFYQGG